MDCNRDHVHTIHCPETAEEERLRHDALRQKGDECIRDHVEDIYWYTTDDKGGPICSEDGWKCLTHGWLGFRPDLDRARIELKVHCVLMDFHESKLIYISNGTMGEVISENVAQRCRTENRYDQDNILRFILDDPNMQPDSTFWQTRAERWLIGAEPIRDEQEALPFP